MYKMVMLMERAMSLKISVQEMVGSITEISQEYVKRRGSLLLQGPVMDASAGGTDS